MFWVVDRLEGNIVVCERSDGVFDNFSRDLLPQECHEGSVLQKNSVGAWELNLSLEQARRTQIYETQQNIFI